MTIKDYYALIDKMLENEPGTINGEEVLADLPKWDSLAIMGFIALLDQHFDMIVPVTKIADCKTMADLAKLVEAKLFRE